MTTADASVRTSACAFAIRARAWMLAYSGKAMAARIPMMATTIISSMSVKPRWLPSSFLRQIPIISCPPLVGVSADRAAPTLRAGRERCTFSASAHRPRERTHAARLSQREITRKRRRSGWADRGRGMRTARPLTALVQAPGREVSIVDDRAAAATQVVLLQLVAELAERHSQELGRLGLHTVRALECPLQVAALEVVQG